MDIVTIIDVVQIVDCGLIIHVSAKTQKKEINNMSLPWDLISGGLGGVFGLVGTIYNSWNQRKMKEMDLKETAMENAQELEKMKLQIQATTDEIKAKTEATKEEYKAKKEYGESVVAGEIDKKDVDSFQQNMADANKNYFEKNYMEKLFITQSKFANFCGIVLCFLFGIVDIIKGIMRPMLTAFSGVCAIALAYQAYLVIKETGSTLSIEQAAELYSAAQSVILFLATMTFTWWFGDRMTEKTYQVIRGKYEDANLRKKN